MVDYISLARNLYDTRIICPADANQTDRVIRWLIDKPGNYFVTMGRSKLPILKDQDGEIYYGLDYCFEYAKPTSCVSAIKELCLPAEPR
jgi:transketolase